MLWLVVQFSNGLPGNKIVCLSGTESTGKTFIALSAAKRFLDLNDKAIVLYFDSESALTKKILESRGIDLSRFGILPVSTVEEFRSQSFKIVDKYISENKKDPVLFILDSLGNLSTTKETTDVLKGAETIDMTRAKLIKSVFRILAVKMGYANIPFIYTNHVYDDIGGGLYAKKVQSGGSGGKYGASITLFFTKAKEKDGDAVIGSIVTATAEKSRLTKENSRVKCLIRYNGGLDRYYGMNDLAEKAGILKKVSTKYELPDGRKVFGKQIENRPEKYWTEDMLKDLDAWIQKEFQYGVGEDEPLEPVSEEENES